jgi:3-oxoacyl-[acyl-carrier protein] reductase
MNTPLPFSGMTVLVTGGSSGIGAATAVAMAARGAKVLVHYNSRQADAAHVLQDISGCHGNGEMIQADLSAIDGVRRLAASIKDRNIDILVNNAGSLIQRTRVLDFTEDLWNHVMMLNLTSAFLLSQAVLPGMVARRKGIIVNVSSLAARTGGGVGALAYSTAKGGISTMTKSLAKEFAPLGIRVNAVSPGTVDTDYHRNFSNDQMLESVKAATPVARLGTVGEIAEIIVFLSSEAASFLHGQIIEVNGGFFMG